jgi:hypothetical protein
VSPDLGFLAQGLLSALTRILEADGGDGPTVAYLNQGEAGQGVGGRVLTLRMDRIIPAPVDSGGVQEARCDWVVTLVRYDWPVAKATLTSVVAPPVADIDIASGLLLDDAVRLFYGLQVARDHDWLVDAACGVDSADFDFGPLGRVPPDSGVAGWQFVLSHPMPPGTICIGE